MGADERMQEITNILRDLKETYPDAKKLSIDIHFAWEETEDYVELCPVVKIYVER